MGHDGHRHLAHTVKDVERVVVEMEKGNREKRLILESRTGEQAFMAFVRAGRLDRGKDKNLE